MRKRAFHLSELYLWGDVRFNKEAMPDLQEAIKVVANWSFIEFAGKK